MCVCVCVWWGWGCVCGCLNKPTQPVLNLWANYVFFKCTHIILSCAMINLASGLLDSICYELDTLDDRFYCITVALPEELYDTIHNGCDFGSRCENANKCTC